jgi:hypothetical protein
MRDHPTDIMELGRLVKGEYRTPANSSCQGAFIVEVPSGKAVLRIIACDGIDKESEGFEHVSVSLRDRTPTWEEMAWVKDQFWMPEEVCFQLHPAHSEYVSCHPHCLHIWRHRIFTLPLPSTKLVGPKK